MYRISIELQKHEWKFGRTIVNGGRNAEGTRAAGECIHSFSSSPKLSRLISITRQKHGEHVFYFFQKTPRREKGKLANFDYQNVNSLCSRHPYINSSRQFCLHRVVEMRFLTNQRAYFFRTVFMLIEKTVHLNFDEQLFLNMKQDPL